MHRDLKLQHALLQQVAAKVGVTEEATKEMRKVVEEAPEGAPVAVLLRTKPLASGTSASLLTPRIATVGKDNDSDSMSSQPRESHTKDRYLMIGIAHGHNRERKALPMSMPRHKHLTGS